MTAMLVSVAELSNIFSVLAVLICFCGVILFIMRNMMVLRVHGDDLMFGNGGGVLPHAPRIPQMKMMKVHIPFTFKLHESFKSTYAGFIQPGEYPTYRDVKIADHGWTVNYSPAMDFLQICSSLFNRVEVCIEVECEVSSQVDYSLQAIWGVSIRELHLALWRPWNALRDASLNGTLLRGHAQFLTPPQARQPHGEQTLRLSLPAPELELGTPPRLCYPLVIFLTRRDTRDLHPDETVALVNVVHIKDSVCTLPTSILAQYLKQANGQLSCLKQLYLATGNPTSYEDDVSTTGLGSTLALAEPCNSTGASGRGTLVASGPGDTAEGSLWNSAGEQLCVVCQFFPLSRALLPCRHTCICASCFGKLERCPMCRSPIKSYFCIRGEEYMPPEKEMNPCKHRQQAPGASHWLHDWNDRLTDFLGFAR